MLCHWKKHQEIAGVADFCDWSSRTMALITSLCCSCARQKYRSTASTSFSGQVTANVCNQACLCLVPSNRWCLVDNAQVCLQHPIVGDIAHLFKVYSPSMRLFVKRVFYFQLFFQFPIAHRSDVPEVSHNKEHLLAEFHLCEYLLFENNNENNNTHAVPYTSSIILWVFTPIRSWSLSVSIGGCKIHGYIIQNFMVVNMVHDCWTNTIVIKLACTYVLFGLCVQSGLHVICTEGTYVVQMVPNKSTVILENMKLFLQQQKSNQYAQ